MLAGRGDLDYLALECLGQRTVALAQVRRRRDPDTGYDSLLEQRMSGGGVTVSLAIDAHGKRLSSALLELEIEAG